MSNVRGPTSALSSFLREHGIQARGHRFQRAQQQTGEDRLLTDNEQSTPEGGDEPEENEEQEHVQLTVNMRDRRRTVASSSRESKKKREDDVDSEPTAKKFKKDAETAQCARCSALFLPTKIFKNYSLCPQCLKLTTVVDKPKAKSKKVVTVHEKVLIDDYNAEILPLRALCIKYIFKYIDHVDVESFGFISDETKDQICRIMSKHRKLNNESLKLFCDPQNKILRLYDCAYIDNIGYEYIAAMSPNLVELVLKECGALDNHSIDNFIGAFPHLQRIHLCGAYLVSDAKMAKFIESCPHLTTFAAEYTQYLGPLSLKALSKCQTLEFLAFRFCSKMSDEHLEALLSLKSIQSLEFQYCQLLSEEILCKLVRRFGSSLKSFRIQNMSSAVTDCLVDQISENCTKLSELGLIQCETITDKSVINLSRKLKRLEVIDLSKCMGLGDEGISSFSRMPTLNIIMLNGLVELSKAVIIELISSVKHLDEADFSWIDSFDDDCLLELCEKRISVLNNKFLIKS